MRSRNPKTGKTEAKQVLSVYQLHDMHLIDLHLSNGEVITCTPVHPIYVQGKGFTPAGQLAVGNAIVTRAGPAVTIDKIVWQPEAEKVGLAGGYAVYNMTVAGDHTYFVGKADGGIWVHNADCPLPVQSVEDALKDLKNGINNVRVGTRDDAEAIRQELVVNADGEFRNSTGYTGNMVRNNPEMFPNGKTGTFHWDYNDTQHGGMSHLQIHDFGGNIFRVFF